MLKKDCEIHIQDPTKTGKRHLCFGRVLEVGYDGLTIAFEKVRFGVEVDQELVVYYNRRRKFVQLDLGRWLLP